MNGSNQELAGFRIGDAVRLPGVAGVFQVIGLRPPAVLILQTQAGARVEAVWTAAQRVAIAGRAVH